MMRKLILATFCALAITGCKKEIIYADTLPQLEIIVFNESEATVTDAVVQLYLTKEDWNSGENLLESTTTDSNGSAKFTELEERIYYFYVFKNEKDNALSISYFENPLKVNEIKVLETIIQ